MAKTNLQLINFLNFARFYLNEHKEKTKFGYALERIDKRLKKPLENYQDAMNDLQIEHAATEGGGGPILTDADGKFRYTKEGLRARNKAQKELLEKLVEFEPHYATEVPENLSEVEKEVCAGFVLPEEAAGPSDGDGVQQPEEATA